MFGNKSAAAPAPAQPPAISGGAAMMLKSMGIDPGAMEQVARDFIGHIEQANARLDAMEKTVNGLRVEVAEMTLMITELKALLSASAKVAPHE